MASRKAAAAAADAQKKRKREKVEDAGRSKKRKPQDEKSEKNKTAIVVKQSGKVSKPAEARQSSRPTSWKLSEPMGGCMSDIDPIFTPDEQRLILAYRTSIQVYSTADSLLERRIKLPQQDGAAGRASRIVGAVLSPLSDELVWVGCADGSVFRVNRSSGVVERLGRKQEPAPKLIGMAVELVQMGKEKKEVLFLSEGTRGAWQVTAHDAGALAKSVGRTLFSHSGATAIEHLRTANDGRIVVGASGKTVFVGGLQLADGQTPKAVTELAYQFFSVDTVDEVSCLDLRTTTKKKGTALDLVLGCARGAIYVYGDVLNRLKNATAEGSRKNKNSGIHPRKYHWHSRSVYAVKWSRDGNYFISGGAETVLVLWQTDTGRLSFLPHLAASIENIVVSPRGSSYAIHLDDNSTMVVSTAEMKPTCYVSGLQSLAFSETPRKDAHVRRAWRPVESITQPVPAVISPTDPSRILLRAGNGLKGTMTGESPSASLLQTFDISAFQSLAKQPLARTNPTDANLTLRGHPVTEPTVTHLCTSHDGRWLVSVDEWQPPPRDISGIAGEPSLQDDWARERREIHLKFWAVEAESEGSSSSSSSNSELPSYELVSRVDEAHHTTQVEPIFGVAADSGRPNRFATLGDDAVVRFWGLRQRVRDGLAAVDERGRALVSWHCMQEVALPLGEGGSQSVAGRNGLVAQEPKTKERRSGALTFSEDGSTVFAAFGAPDEAVLYTIDAESGAVRASLPGMFRGDVRGVESLGATLILLSEDLRVYDIVADELRYGVRLLGGGDAEDEDKDKDKEKKEKKSKAFAESSAYSSLTQLVVGRQSQTFAVAVPHAPTTKVAVSAAPRAASRPQSRLLVFSPEHAQPLLVEELPHLVVSLLPAVGLSGFLAIDSAAQIWSVVDAADTAVLGQPLSDLDLPMTMAAGKQRLQLTNGVEEDKEMTDVVGAAEDAAAEDGEEDDEEDEEEKKDDDDDDDDDDTHAAVIAPQKLRDIFDAAPATSTSIEELFWQVSGLLSALPQLVPAGRS